ncbi:MAG: hypothetical protein AMJ94_18480 [Deltaproteobacteria bacterium SM23_61]|nr:MAG: hypothetical protein AMJ94_18480 [Deltaproteobacteria bacterium SM23_61]
MADDSVKDKTAKGISGNDLCALRFLYAHPLFFHPRRIRGTIAFYSSKGEKNHIPQRSGMTQRG